MIVLHWKISHNDEEIPLRENPGSHYGLVFQKVDLLNWEVYNSLKVPTVICWPAKIKPGIVVQQSLTVLDWFPTLLDMAGIKQPSGLQLRGRNFMPLLMGQEPIDWQNEIFGQYSTHHQSRTHMRMYRTREYKLIRDFLNPQRSELYDLIKDPEENTNLYFEPGMDSVKSAMNIILLEKMQEINDPVVQEYDL